MLRRRFNHAQKAQMLVEYTIILTSIILILIAMNTFLKRGIQGMIKVATDQIGTQENAEQRFDESGHMEAFYSTTRADTSKTVREFVGDTNYIYSDIILTRKNTATNLGFTNED